MISLFPNFGVLLKEVGWDVVLNSTPASSSPGHSSCTRLNVIHSDEPLSNATLCRHPPRDDFISSMVPSHRVF